MSCQKVCATWWWGLELIPRPSLTFSLSWWLPVLVAAVSEVGVSSSRPTIPLVSVKVPIRLVAAVPVWVESRPTAVIPAIVIIGLGWSRHVLLLHWPTIDMFSGRPHAAGALAGRRSAAVWPSWAKLPGGREAGHQLAGEWLLATGLPGLRGRYRPCGRRDPVENPAVDLGGNHNW